MCSGPTRRQLGLGALGAFALGGLASACDGRQDETDDGEPAPLVGSLVVPPELPQAPPTAVIDVRLFDGRDVHDRVTVLLADGLVQAVGEQVDVPADAEIVDGAGHTLLPALIDAHVHASAAGLAQALRFGVGTELDMFQVEGYAQVRDEQTVTGAVERADVFTAAQMATAPGGHGTQFEVPGLETLTAPDQAPAWVAARQAEGAAYIKIVRESRMPTLEPEIITALADAAHEAGLRALVHAQISDDVRVALDTPIDGLVHAPWNAIDDDLLAQIVDSGVLVITTAGLSVLPESKPVLADDGVLARVDPEAIDWFRDTGYARAETEDAMRETLPMLVAAGVPLLAGTDAPNPGTTDGAGVLVELELLVDAGMAPADALRAATGTPAEIFGLTDRGLLEPGRRADAVLVAGDPTSDITAMRDLQQVWCWGVPAERGA